MTASFLRRATLAGVAAALVAAGTAGAVIGLPSDGSQVNNDPAAGIDPNQNAGVSDVVGGSLVAGGPRVPWATFEQKAGDAQRIFVRAFKNGQWVTQGPSLNIDQNVEAEGALDRLRRRGAHRAVGRVVRAQRGARRREADLRQPLRGRQQHLAARGAGPRIGCPVAEHQHRQGGREPVGRRRGRRGGRRPGAVGRVGGAGRQRQRLRQPRPDLRLQGRQAGRSERAVCRLQAVGQRQRQRTSAGSRSASTAWPRTAARRRPATRR